MEKRGSYQSKDKRVEVLQQTVRLQLQKNLRLKTTGPVTGKQYFFGGAGAVVEVDVLDAPGMLEKKPNRPCCSGSFGSPYFSLVEV